MELTLLLKRLNAWQMKPLPEGQCFPSGFEGQARDGGVSETSRGFRERPHLLQAEQLHFCLLYLWGSA